MSCSCTVTGTPVEVSDEIAMAILAESLCTKSMIDLLAWKMVGFDFDIFTELFMTVVLVAVSALEVLVPTSNAIELRSPMIIVLAGAVIGITPRIDDVFANMDPNIFADTMGALESLPTLVSS